MIDGSTLTGALTAAFEKRGDGPCIEFDGVSLSAKQVLAQVKRRRRTFADAGFVDGMVMLASGNGASTMLDFLTIWLSGGIAVRFDPKADSATLGAIVKITNPQLIIGRDGGFADLGVSTPIIPPGAVDDLDSAAADETIESNRSVTPEDCAAILFTSGSTGRPKGVVLSHRSLLGNVLGAQERLQMTPNDRLFVSIPLHFTSAIHHFVTAMVSGAVLVGTESVLLQRSLYDAVRTARATCFGGAPMQLRWLAGVAATEGALPLSFAMSSGDSLSIDVIDLWLAHQANSKLHTVYGLTEVGGRLCFLEPSLLPDKAGSVGTPITGLRVSIHDDNGMEIHEPNTQGQIAVRGDLLFDGYYGAPEETAKAISDSTFWTGDLGYKDADGCLYVAGRMDDVFKSGGQKVHAPSIARSLMETNSFDDVAVWPVNLEGYGKVPHVFYKLKADAVFERGRVMSYLRQHLPSSHLPRGFTAVDEIPRTGSGKIKRLEMNKLAEKIENGTT